ncbi:MAG: 50S ribosomal protein L18 [Candidatus Komeilibacteria bacterium]
MAKTKFKKLVNKTRRQQRVRSKLQGTAQRPRLSIHRSLRYMSAQAIDDTQNKTLVGLYESNLKLSGDKIKRAQAFAEKLAEVLASKGIKKIIFDKGPYQYHGRVKAVADGLRSAGIEF